MSKETKENCREEQAKREIGVTDISRGAAIAVSIAFMAAIGGVAVMQHGIALRELSRNDVSGKLSFWGAFDGAGGAMLEAWRSAATLPRRVLDPNAVLLKRIDAFQEEIDDTCFLTELTVGPVQEWLCRLGAGNEKAYVGQKGWLFYEPGVHYVTGPGFLEPRRLSARSAGGNEYVDPPQPDPRRAILDFAEQLGERGIRLIVVPAPVKPSIHPEHFGRRRGVTGQPIQNRSYEAFKRDLEASGVLVFDPAPALAQAAAETGTAQYLRTDTHWTPTAMARCAEALARFVEQHIPLRPGNSNRLVRTEMTMTNDGDIAAMLKLQPDQDLYPPQSVTVHQVNARRDGALWQPDKTAEILLLGDSFANIYSIPEMRWGESAGLAPQLSFCLGRSVDALTRNDGGAHTTRKMLSRRLARGEDRLAGKQVVIWEFAARELAVGDWKLIDMAVGEAPQSGFFVPAPGSSVVVEAVVSARTGAPRPGSVPYKDHILSVLLEDLRSGDIPPEGNRVLVYMSSMVDNVWQTPARYREGRKVRLRLQNWEDVERRYGSLNRSEFDDESIMLESPCWGTEVEGQL